MSTWIIHFRDIQHNFERNLGLQFSTLWYGFPQWKIRFISTLYVNFNMASFIVYINNAVIKFSIYILLRTCEQLMNIIPKCFHVLIQDRFVLKCSFCFFIYIHFVHRNTGDIDTWLLIYFTIVLAFYLFKFQKSKWHIARDKCVHGWSLVGFVLLDL